MIRSGAGRTHSAQRSVLNTKITNIFKYFDGGGGGGGGGFCHSVNHVHLFLIRSMNISE